MAQDLGRIVRVGALLVSGAAVAFWLGVLVYAVGSFALMRPHTKARHLGISARELWRELFNALWTQPLLPLYYLIGRRMDGVAVGVLGRRSSALAGPPVVFVHGYMQNRVGFVGLARALVRAGRGPLYGFNYPWISSLASNAERLERFIARVCEETESSTVDLVCHSMGGLVAVEMMRDEARDNALKIRKCVTIATPHAGVVWRGPMIGFGATSLRRGSQLLLAQAGSALRVPFLSVYSSHDNIVHPPASSQLAQRGGRDVEVEGLAHLSILFSPRVAEHVVSFLSDGAEGAAIVPAHGDPSSVLTDEPSDR